MVRLVPGFTHFIGQMLTATHFGKFLYCANRAIELADIFSSEPPCPTKVRA